MAQAINQVSYGFSQPLIAESPPPIIGKRAPTVNDLGYALGQIWIYNNVAYTLVNNSNNTALWTQGVASAQVVLSSAQVQTLRASPVTLVPAPGPGKFIAVTFTAAKLFYGGSNAFVAAAAQTIALYYNNTSGQFINTCLPNAEITATVNKTSMFAQINVGASSSVFENLPVVISNSSATEISGNAAGDNTISVFINYSVVSL